MARDATAEEIVKAIKEGTAGVWALRANGLTAEGLAAFQNDALMVIDEARQHGLEPNPHFTGEQGFRWLDLVVVEIP